MPITFSFRPHSSRLSATASDWEEPVLFSRGGTPNNCSSPPLLTRMANLSTFSFLVRLGNNLPSQCTTVPSKFLFLNLSLTCFVLCSLKIILRSLIVVRLRTNSSVFTFKASTG
uniref:Uncharacterized protein n=1 Tax=Cacopsylla melanoneura TaxID=428564 RepID=A0A8D8RFN2_9HEMI